MLSSRGWEDSTDSTGWIESFKGVEKSNVNGCMMEVVWSINIMITLLVLAVMAVIYYIMRYDLYNPND